MSFVLETRKLDVRIAGKRVCAGLDLHIAAGECWAVLGPNGSGKTTLLHTLTGLRAADGGTVLINGRPLKNWPARELARAVGTLFQTQDDPFPSTVLESVLIGRHPHLRRWEWESEDDRRRAAAALAEVDLAGFESRGVASLSGGERRRVMIAGVLCQDPALFALDEPTNHLDLHHQAKMLTLFDRLATRHAKSVLMVLHDVTGAARFCDHVLLVFGDGEVLAGRTMELLTEDTLTRLYGHPLHRVSGPDGELWVPAMRR